jgi:hypothetical protein
MHYLSSAHYAGKILVPLRLYMLKLIIPCTYIVPQQDRDWMYTTTQHADTAMSLQSLVNVIGIAIIAVTVLRLFSYLFLSCRCTVCSWYHLCSTCFHQQIHVEHSFEFKQVCDINLRYETRIFSGRTANRHRHTDGSMKFCGYY